MAGGVGLLSIFRLPRYSTFIDLLLQELHPPRLRPHFLHVYAPVWPLDIFDEKEQAVLPWVLALLAFPLTDIGEEVGFPKSAIEQGQRPRLRVDRDAGALLCVIEPRGWGDAGFCEHRRARGIAFRCPVEHKPKLKDHRPKSHQKDDQHIVIS